MTVQNVWGGLVIWYLFLAGTGAGVYMLAIGNKLLRKRDELAKTGYIFGPALVILGTIALLFDLGRPQLAFFAVLRPQASMISVGTIILTLFILNGFLQLYGVFLRKKDPPKILDITGFILAVGTATYTGLLLGVVKAIPFWNNPIILPSLFLVSALSSGVGCLVLITFVMRTINSEKTQQILHGIMKLDVWLILSELAFIAMLFGISSKGHPAALASVKILTQGFFAIPFWGLVILMGLIFPLILETLIRQSRPNMWLLCSLALLIGGVTLRYSIVVAGVWVPMVK